MSAWHYSLPHLHCLLSPRQPGVMGVGVGGEGVGGGRGLGWDRDRALWILPIKGLWESDAGPLEERVQRGHQGFMSEP